MAEKYYYPRIEEIRVGYECEINDALGFKEDYVPTKLELKEPDGAYLCHVQDTIEMMDDGYGEVRVPFLSEEQILAEGWEELPDLSPFTGKPYKFQKKKEECFNEPHIWTLEFHGEANWEIKIHHFWESSYNRFSEYIYQGKCPDINTFRYLCDLLGIK